MPPIGFVILTHSNPQQISRLIHALNTVYDTPPIALHHDFNKCPAELALPPNVKVVRPHLATAWGQFSLVRATLAGLAALYSDSVKPKWFALLSGACYPTKHAKEALADLERGGYDAYMHHELIDPLAPRRRYHDICLWRYFSYQLPWFMPVQGTGIAYKNLPTPQLLSLLSPYVRKNFRCYAGAQWFTATEQIAEYILRWSHQNPWLGIHLQNRPSPDETYFHSIIGNVQDLRVSANSFRYIDWSLGGAHPKLLQVEDVSAILASGSHFARKFEPDSPALDYLDEYLGITSGRNVPVVMSAKGFAHCSEIRQCPETSHEGKKQAQRAKFSVIIPTHRRAASLERTLGSLESQTDLNFEVIVVCDGEDPATRKLSNSYIGRLELKWHFTDHNCYAAAARNLGASIASGDFLLFLDDDATADAQWVEMHRKRHEAETSSRLILVFGRLVHVYDRAPHSPTERLLRKERDERDQRYVAALGNPDSCSAEQLQLYCVCGFNCSLRRDVFWMSGGYDPKMRPKNEDAELGLRLYSMGVETVVELRAILYHHDPKDLVVDTRLYWKSSGPLELYRFTSKGQRNEQLGVLRRLRTANPVRRLHQALSWHHPEMMRASGELARSLCDITGSSRLLRQWQRLEVLTDFLQAIKQDQVKLEDVRNLVGRPLLVLALQNISRCSNPDERKYHLSPRKFRAFLDLLKFLKFQNVSAEHCVSEQLARSFVLTIDGAYESLYTELMPLVHSYQLKPLLFLVVDQIGGFNAWESTMGYSKRKLLSLEQIRDMQRDGIEFGSLTCSHPWLPSLSDSDLQQEIQDSKHKLEDLLGVEVTKFAYPYGGTNARVRAMVARAGYRWGFSARPGLSFWDDPMLIKRVNLGNSDSMLNILLKIFVGKSVGELSFQEFIHFRSLRRSNE